MTSRQRKYLVRSTIAINGRQYDVQGLHWATSQAAAKAAEIAFRRGISGCSTIQVWNVTIPD